MKIYTKTGDFGETSLYGGTRVSKADIRIAAYGTVDELNSYLGLVRSLPMDSQSFKVLVKVQEELFTVGALLATPQEKRTLKNGKQRLGTTAIKPAMIAFLETEIDAMNANLPPMTHFVLPGGGGVVSYCHIARTVCRRAERLTVLLSQKETIDTEVIVYLNRLSDYLFVLARKLTFDNEIEEIKWIPSK